MNDFRVVGREVSWLARASILNSGFTGARLEKLLGTRTTLRNVNTPKQIAEKFA